MSKRRLNETAHRYRIRRLMALGFSRSQASGKPRPGEFAVSDPRSWPKSDAKIETAIRLMRDGLTMTDAAKAVRMSPSRLSRFLKINKVARIQGRNWVWTDRRIRQIPFLLWDRQRAIKVEGFDPASRIGKYYNAVHLFLGSNDPIYLEPFVGETVADIRGQTFDFVTDESALYRFSDRDEPAFHEIYKVVAA